MGIVLSQNFKQSQKISLTPSLKKSIDLLQLSRYELVNKIQQEIEDNPFIEKIEDYEISSNINDDFNFEFSSRLTLRESLLDQIDDFGLDEHYRKICILIIENINEMGGLDLQVEELEKISNYKFKQKEIEGLLIGVIHKLSPTGIGFRNFKECIMLQIESKNLSKKLFHSCSNIVFNDFLDDLDKIKNNFVKCEEDLSLFNLALKEIKNFYDIDINNIYVIHDEIDLDQGHVKVKNGGGHNGHNGLKSIDKFIGKNYNRVRIGVSRPSKIYEENIDENISNWVLSDFTSNEKEQWLDNTINYVSEMIVSLIKSQNNFCNKKV